MPSGLDRSSERRVWKLIFGLSALIPGLGLRLKGEEAALQNLMLIKQTLASSGHLTEGAAACSSKKSYSGRLHRGGRDPVGHLPWSHVAPPRGHKQDSPQVTPQSLPLTRDRPSQLRKAQGLSPWLPGVWGHAFFCSHTRLLPGVEMRFSSCCREDNSWLHVGAVSLTYCLSRCYYTKRPASENPAPLPVSWSAFVQSPVHL